MKLQQAAVKAAVALVIFAVGATPSSAHEFWVSPDAGKVIPGDIITANLKVGVMLKGEPYPYLSDRFRSFDVTTRLRKNAVVSSEGDLPALTGVAAARGLHIISHQTVAFKVKHDDWQIFQRYLKEEGLADFEQAHLQRGLPKQGFVERYTRYARGLVQSGPLDKEDTDRSSGMIFEVMADKNPYTDGLKQLPVTLTWHGKPVAHRQINVFHDKNGKVSRTSVQTNAAGRAIIDLAGTGEYLLNAVHIEPADDQPVVWSSHWATLSFRL